MRILHTSDIHLTTKGNPHFGERWDSLEKIVKLSKELDIDVVVISGDLFDNSRAADVLRGEIREIFEASESKIIILPGNHDREAFSSGNFYGSNVVVLNDSSPVEVGGISFWGIPFFEASPAKVAVKIGELKGKVNHPEKSLLVIHGELLDISGGWDVYGDEGRGQYFPFKLSYFRGEKREGVGWKYILAGHFHSNFILKTVSGNRNGEVSYFVYPGSPVSVTEKETGRRKVSVFEFGKVPVEYPIDSFYYEEVTVRISPFDSLLPLERIEKSIDERHIGSLSKLIVSVEGFYDREQVGMEEGELVSAIKKLLSRWRLAREPVVRVTNIEKLLRDEIYEAFEEKLIKEPIGEDERNVIRELMIKAMIEIG